MYAAGSSTAGPCHGPQLAVVAKVTRPTTGVMWFANGPRQGKDL